MKKTLTYTINFIILLSVIAGTFTIATIALNQKIVAYEKTSGILNGAVEKKESIVIAKARGNISKIYFSEGEEVRKGNKLAELTNPDLSNRIDSLSEFEDNESAQTELELAKKEVNDLTIIANTNGYINTVSYPEGSSVNPSDKLFSIISNENTKLFFLLSEDEYSLIIEKKEVNFYNNRLGQSIKGKVIGVQPKAQRDESGIKKIGVYFSLVNPEDGNKLIHEENIVLQLGDKREATEKPLDTLRKIWGNILHYGK